MKSRSHLLVLAMFCAACHQTKDAKITGTISNTMDNVMTRIYETVPQNKFDSLDEEFLDHFLTSDEKLVLSTQYQHFNVNVPATVSLMRDKGQPVVPFWLKASGFVKTDITVKSEAYEYEVWQKNFDTGRVELGINGFDKHRPVYFVSVAPQQKGLELVISDVFPEYVLDTLKVGSFTYHDWSGLTLTEVPDSLRGQILFTTVRGRAREAHIIDAFRKTIFPSSQQPDQVLLTWNDSPTSSMNIQWRTNSDTHTGLVKYWTADEHDTLKQDASRKLIEDRMLYNDRYVQRFTASLKKLKPGTSYLYQVGSTQTNIWSKPEQFKTAPLNTTKFSLVWFGDTHCFPDSGKLALLAEKRNQDASFYMIAGDIVSTGLYRDDWDRLFGYDGGAFSRKPLMPVPGNHDRQDGLGAQLYYDLFSLPENGPAKVDKESSYAFEYGNALFVMIDATADVDLHTAWLEQKLSSTKAKWKFVMFHFPPYNFEEPYLDIQQAWVPLFDKYHVDMVLGGHIHYYMRSRPMNNGKVVPSFDKGTVYAISISIPSKHLSMTQEPYAATQYDEGYFYQRMEFNGNTMKYSSVDSKGNVRDKFEIVK
ncbi:MAG: metallophosphoesterase family protein [Chryseolinea sp.]